MKFQKGNVYEKDGSIVVVKTTQVQLAHARFPVDSSTRDFHIATGNTKAVVESMNFVGNIPQVWKLDKYQLRSIARKMVKA